MGRGATMLLTVLGLLWVAGSDDINLLRLAVLAAALFSPFVITTFWRV